jgi:glycosyltransferase involved in cell wall biosynthesis
MNRTVQQKKIAIVYDWIDKWGGVERLLLQLHELFPQAEFYTSYYDVVRASWAKNLTIRSSFIQSLPRFIKENRITSLLLYPYAFESLDLREYDIVISVTSSFAKGIITKADTMHITYLLTPTRFLWGMSDIYISQPWLKMLTAPFIHCLREWDYIAAQRPDHIIAISQTVAQRCKKYYQRPSEVIYPGFDTEYWEKIKSQNEQNKTVHQNITSVRKKFFLVVSRLEKYKRIDLVIKVFNKDPHYQFIIVGEGTQREKLEYMSEKNITFLGKVNDEELAELYSHAEALVMPQEEDFGYVALEAHYFGCPVIAYGKGGALETVISNETGVFFDEQTSDSFSLALARFHTISYNLKNNLKDNYRKYMERFSKNTFKLQFTKYIGNL